MEKEVVHLSQFYPCSKVTLGSELYYICELGKYLGDYNKCLSIDGIILDNILRKSRFWDYMRVAVKNGWLVDVGIDKFELDITVQNQINLKDVRNIHITTDEVKFDREDLQKRQEDVYYDWMTPKEVQVSFLLQSKQYWAWELNGDGGAGFGMNQRGLNVKNASQSWVTLTAYVAVHRLMTGEPDEFWVKFNTAIMSNKQLSVVDIMLLAEETDALNGWFNYTLDAPNSLVLHCGYEAWWYKGYEQGYLRREYFRDEKRKYFFDLGLKLNDVVLLYERKSCQKANYIKEIDNMHFAIVREVSKLGVTLEVVNNKKTRFGYELGFSHFKKSVQEMYKGGTGYKDYRKTMKNFSWSDIGMNYMMYSEQYFITPLQLEDTVALDVTNGESEDYIILDEANAIYWILKDYGVEFNEEHYLETYFKDKKTAYERYMNGDSLDDFERSEHVEWLEKEDEDEEDY